MRSTLVIGTLVTLAGSAAPALAQAYPMQATITQPSVEVRSGPTDKFYPTLQLHQGDTVVVLGPSAQPGWLEIRPPARSFNWINAKNVKTVGMCVIVDPVNNSAETEARVGSGLHGGEPSAVAKHGYLRGAILDVVGPGAIDNGETWLAVQPDSRDVRYIPANAVNVPAITAPATLALGSKASNPTPALIPGHPGNGEVTPASTTAFSTPVGPSITPTPMLGPPPAAPVTSPAQWSGWGKLVKTTFRTSDNQPMYVLVNPRGEPQIYATSAPGYNLGGYVDKTVCLYGSTVYRPGEAVNTRYMIASHVAVP